MEVYELEISIKNKSDLCSVLAGKTKSYIVVKSVVCVLQMMICEPTMKV